jgi:D-alanyl-D-alanine carboxypeptidase
MVWRVQPLKLLLVFLVLAGVILSAVDADAARKKRKRHRHVGPPAPYVEKYAAIVLDASSGRILYERMSNEARYPASLTKMMTLYLLFEQLQKGAVTLSTPLTASQYACSQEPTRLGLKPAIKSLSKTRSRRSSCAQPTTSPSWSPNIWAAANTPSPRA